MLTLMKVEKPLESADPSHNFLSGGLVSSSNYNK